MKPYKPKPGTLMQRVHDAIKMNPWISRSELAQMLGERLQDISLSLKLLKDKGFAVPEYVMRPGYSKYRYTTNPKVARTIKLLTNTILQFVEIEHRLHLREKYTNRINMFNRCRTRFVSNAIGSGKGIIIEKMPEPFNKFPKAGIEKIMGENAKGIKAMVNFPIEDRQAELHRHVADYVRRGLERYSPELGSGRHIALLLATRAIYDYSLRAIEGIEVRRWPIMRTLSYGQRCEEISGLQKPIQEYVHSKVLESFADDMTQDALLACFYLLDRYAPRKGSLHSFARTVSDVVISQYYWKHRQDIAVKAALRAEKSAPETRHKPKAKEHK